VNCVVYGYFNGFFVFAGREKTKKRGSEGARARDGGSRSELVPVVVQLVTGRGIVGGMPAAGLKVCRRCSWRLLGSWWWYLVYFKSKYKYTPLLLWCGDAIKYYFAPLEYCTMPDGLAVVVRW
jgi:hypothetical protein